MDVREHFRSVVVPSYTQFKEKGDFRSLQSAILSMYTMAEHVGLERLRYPPVVSRNERRQHAQAVRVELGLVPLQTCADVLRHVRSNTDRGTLSSTSIDPNNQATWYINEKYLPNVADDSFAKLSGLLNKPST